MVCFSRPESNNDYEGGGGPKVDLRIALQAEASSEYDTSRDAYGQSRQFRK